MRHRIRLVLNSIYMAFQSPYFGFIQGHSHLKQDNLSQIKQLVGKQADDVISDFENRFAELIGEGEAIAYAAGRMGFYDLMRTIDVGKGDEVILLGATCAVMSTAVIRTGATPIYADIDPDTFGSSSKAIATCITKKTRMIVAQHSFGIPCDIESIVKIAQEENIFLLEDCALTLGSKVNDIVAGNFGDAALFSTDHSKPINTMIGGMIYIKDKNLANLLRSSRNLCEELPVKKQYAIWHRLLVERWFCNSKHYGKMQLVDLFYSVGKKFFRLTEPFLVDDYKSELGTRGHPYPAKLPAFLAQLGIYEVDRWHSNLNARKNIFYSFINSVNNTNIKKFLPAAYTKSSIDIVPFRFVWTEPNGEDRRDVFSDFIRVDWTWFMEPIISTKEPLEELGYFNGTCPDSEKITRGMVNVPSNLLGEEEQWLLKKLNSVLS